MRKIYESIQNLDYFCCLKERHENLPLNTICADCSCLNRCLLCPYCEQQNHINHDIISFKGYLQKVLISANININDENIIRWAELIEKTKNECITNLQNFKSQILSHIDSLLHQISIQYQQSSVKIKQILSTHEQINSFINNYNQVHNKFYNHNYPKNKTSQQIKIYQRDLAKINKRLQNLLKYTAVESMQFQNNGNDSQLCTQTYKLSSLSPQIQIISQSYISKCKAVNKNLSKIVNQMIRVTNKSIENLRQQIKTVNSFKATSFSWSESQKAAAILINGKIAQRKSGSNVQRFALFKQELLPFIQKKKNIAWAVKIVKLTGWIGIGVCLKEKIITSGYKFNYENLGHGSYMISSNGYTWSSSVLTSNSAYHSFNFTTGDFVILQFVGDPEWKLNFYVCKEQVLIEKSTNNKGKGSQICISKSQLPSLKQSGQKLLPIKVNLDDLTKTHVLELQQHLDYIPCVNLCSVGDTVSIVS